jgi:dTDP-4-amino-4,6-dideoxygalactose transaminase
MINISKPYLPSINEYQKYLQGIWKNSWITNNGPLVKELEKNLEEYLGVKHVHFVSSGTTALQIAIKAAELSGEVITSAFSYIATIDAIFWTNCVPVLVDIDQKTLCADPLKIEAAITNKTSAILVTHVYGNPCDVEKIKDIAKANNLKIIYDGAHAFNVKLFGQSIFNYGDISMVSFHATKLYHTIEGGAIITNNADLAEKCRLITNFGLYQNIPGILGINGKNSEFHAAMGLCNLPKVNDFIAKRKLLSEEYKNQLSSLTLQYPEIALNVDYNYAYFPIIFPSEKTLMIVKETLEKNKIYPRRYFFPSFSNLPFYKGNFCPISEEISKKILCLPLYYDLSICEVKLITSLIKSAMNIKKI